MDASEEYDGLIWPTKTACRMFNGWPDQDVIDDKKPTLLLIRPIIKITVFVLMLIGAVGAFLETVLFWGDDMNMTIESSLVTSAFCMASLRIAVFFIHEREILFVVETMRQDWVHSTIEERQILRKECHLAFRFTKFFIGNVAMAGSFFIMVPILQLAFGGGEEGKVLPFHGYYFFNYSTSPVYERTFVANSMIGILGCSTIAGGTSFSFLATMHAAAKFSYIRETAMKLDVTDWNSKKKTKDFIQRHQESIRFAGIVEEIINLLALGQFVVSTGLLCFAGFQLRTTLEDPRILMKYTSFLTAAIMELFVLSYSGQSLITQSEGIAESVYLSKWVGSSFPSSVRLIILRSRKPCTITSGKFYDVSFESFIKVLNASFSYFSVLVAMKEE